MLRERKPWQRFSYREPTTNLSMCSAQADKSTPLPDVHKCIKLTAYTCRCYILNLLEDGLMIIIALAKTADAMPVARA